MPKGVSCCVVAPCRRSIIDDTLPYLLPVSRTHQGRRATLLTSATIFCHLRRSSAALWLLLKSRPVHSLMLSSHIFFCLPLFRFPGRPTVPCTIFLQRPINLITSPNNRNFLYPSFYYIFVRTVGCLYFLHTISFVMWSLYEMCKRRP